MFFVGAILQSLGVLFPVEFLYELQCITQNNDIPVKIGKTTNLCSIGRKKCAVFCMTLNCDLEKDGCMFLEWRSIKLYYWLSFVFIKEKFVGCKCAI